MLSYACNVYKCIKICGFRLCLNCCLLVHVNTNKMHFNDENEYYKPKIAQLITTCEFLTKTCTPDLREVNDAPADRPVSAHHLLHRRRAAHHSARSGRDATERESALERHRDRHAHGARTVAPVVGQSIPVAVVSSAHSSETDLLHVGY